MAASERVLEIVIRAKNEATKVISRAANDMDKFTKAGMAGAAITGVGIASAVALNKAADAAAKYGSAVVTIQRITGATAEESSAYAAMLQRLGVEGKGAGIIFKSLDTAIVGHSKALAAAGIATQDESGHNREAMDVLRDLADYYSTATDKTAAVALAAKTLGRGYMSLLPVLANGAKGIDDLNAKARESGLILGQDAVDAVRKYNGALKDNQQAQMGLTVQLGLAVLPIKTFIEEGLVKMFGWLNKHPLIKKTAIGIGLVTTALALVIGPALILIGALPALSLGFSMVGVGASRAAFGVGEFVFSATAASIAVGALTIALGVGLGIALNRIIEEYAPGVNRAFEGMGRSAQDFFDSILGRDQGYYDEMAAEQYLADRKVTSGKDMNESSTRRLIAATKALTESTKLSTDATNTANGAELTMLQTKQRLKDAQKNLHEVGKHAKKGSDEYRIAQLEVRAAQNDLTTATDKYREAADKARAANEKSAKDKALQVKLAAIMRAWDKAADAADRYRHKSQVALATKYAGDSVHRTSGIQAGGGVPEPHAMGGFSTGPEIIQWGEDGTELILPLTKPKRTQELLGQAGLVTSSARTTNVTNVYNIDAGDAASESRIAAIVGAILQGGMDASTLQAALT